MSLGFHLGLEAGLGDRRGANGALGGVTTVSYRFLVGWLIPTLQSLFLLVGQRDFFRGFVNGRGQLSVDRRKGRVGDISTPESAADDHAECIEVQILDVGRRFDNAASDNAGPLPDQLGGTEGVGEDVVVQARDTTEPINRDRTDFMEKVSARRVPNRPSYLLSLSGLTSPGTRAEHLDDGVCGNGGKTVCDGAIGELLNCIADFPDPRIAFLYCDADVGVLVEHLVDGDEVLIVLIMTAGTQNISPIQCVAVKTMHTQSCRRRGQYDPGPFPRGGPRSPWRPWRSRWS